MKRPEGADWVVRLCEEQYLIFLKILKYVGHKLAPIGVIDAFMTNMRKEKESLLHLLLSFIENGEYFMKHFSIQFHISLSLKSQYRKYPLFVNSKKRTKSVCVIHEN